MGTVSHFTTASGVIEDDPNDSDDAPLTTGDTVKLADDYTGGGIAGAVYRFLGPDATAPVDLGAEDYSDIDAMGAGRVRLRPDHAGR